MEYKSENLNILDIYLDSENPRHDPIKNQSKIIDYLVKNEGVKALAKDIALNGTSPLELLGVYKNRDGRYIALEGNRRLCALILLNDPERSPKGEVPYFKKLINGKSIPNDITAVTFNSREAADLWIERRHEGPQGGIGIKSWDATQKSRHKTKREKSDDNAMALTLLDYALDKGFISEEEKKSRLTTATRYLGTPFFRQTLGLKSSRTNSKVELGVPIDEFDTVLEVFCRDLADNKKVNSRSNKADRVNYAKNLISDGVAPTTHMKTYNLAESDTKGKKTTPNPNSNTNSNRGSGTPHPNKRKYLFPNGFSPKISNSNLSKVYREIKGLSVDDYPLAVSLLARAFLENIYKAYFEKTLGSYGKKKTHEVLDKIIKHIETNSNSLSKSEKDALGALKRVQANENNVLSAKTLGAFAHAGHYPQASELKTEWDNISVMIEHILKELE